MLIIDAHLDLAWNALGWNRDLSLTVPEIRASEAGLTGKARGHNTVAFPEMRKGQVGISIATLLARANARTMNPMLDFRTQEIASAVALGQLSYYRLLEKRGVCSIIRDARSLQDSVAAWSDGRTDAPFGFIISMEGADPIASPDDAAEWFHADLRIIGLAHYGPGVYAHGTASTGGLTPKGRDLLNAMEQLGFVLDMTHLADESFWEAAKLFHGPVLASHNNCRKLTPGDRQFDDDQIRFLIERGGVIGTVLDSWMLVPGWTADPATHEPATLERAVDNIDHICQLAGNTSHVAIGSDLDGGFGTEQSPDGLDTIADLQKFGPLLRARGYLDSDIEAIFYRNWLQFFTRSWNEPSR